MPRASPEIEAAMWCRCGDPAVDGLTEARSPEIIRAVHSLSRRLTAVAALALWTAAGLSPLAVALHVALHPQGHGEHLHTQHLRTRHAHSRHAHGRHLSSPHPHEVHVHAESLQAETPEPWHSHGEHGHGERAHDGHVHDQRLHDRDARATETATHEPSQLLQVSGSGHPHDAEAVPNREHEAVTRSTAPVPETSPILLATLPSPWSRAPLGDRPRLDRVPHRGPPAPLFTTHCSLLL